jgi:hypothetical protein
MTPTNVTRLAFAAALPPALMSPSVLGQDDCRLRWDTTVGQPGVSSGTIRAMLPFDDGSGPALFIGGKFDGIGGVEASNVARWNGTSFEPLGAGISGPGISSEVRALCVYDDGQGPSLYAGGFFQHADGHPVGFSIARWDGEAWYAVGGGLEGQTPQVNAMTVFDDGTGPALIIGGQLRSPDATANDGIVAWNGETYRSLGAGISGTPGQVNALAAIPAPSFTGGNDWLIVGGHFQGAGEISVEGVARWNGVEWATLGDGIDGSVTTVKDVLIHNDGAGVAAYMTGDFTSAGGEPASSAARWYWGNTWEPLGDSYLVNATIGTFDAGAGSELYAATAAGFRVWRDDAWEEASPGVWGVLALAAFDDGHGQDALYIGGAFTQVNGATAERFARWRCTCPADLDGSGDVGVADLALVIVSWGTSEGDVDGDGSTDEADLVAVLLAWGGSCPEDA